EETTFNDRPSGRPSLARKCRPAAAEPKPCFPAAPVPTDSLLLRCLSSSRVLNQLENLRQEIDNARPSDQHRGKNGRAERTRHRRKQQYERNERHERNDQ